MDRRWFTSSCGSEVSEDVGTVQPSCDGVTTRPPLGAPSPRARSSGTNVMAPSGTQGSGDKGTVRAWPGGTT